ncbi:flagellin-like protein [Methanohalophilus levihalophilus]|uniref:archaellin/type IV pilin N-terminal domain-containing protein n=1 Tax=Methanohalophilus levihalophilus TaxID=1431282 RepID=UPI001AE26480|nr:archaellin/type IV pilin N-terminal domain-containing protein [Methanohalophilus levihalophilus]MBP2029451.1 flagellin-like protein [Methanohalophilus levihalophilus]
MPSKEMLSFLRDEKGISVVFGTLLLILITITAAASLALFVSETQKSMMEREEHISAVENEELRILKLQPSGNSSHWSTLNITLLNLNTADSRIASIALNNNFVFNYLLLTSTGDVEYNSKYPDYPVIYNSKVRPRIKATSSLTLSVPFEYIVVNTTESFSLGSWSNMTENFTFKLQNHPVLANYPVDCNIEVYNVSNNNSLVLETGNFSIDVEGDDPLMTILAGGRMSNSSSYRVDYSSTFVTFNSLSSISRNEPLQVEVITSLINIFGDTYTPPVPLASVNYETERWMVNGTPYYQDVLVLDASQSFDDDGSIVSYRWAAWTNSTLVYSYNLTGKVARASLINPYDSNVTIDLEVVDDMGMVSRLSERGGIIQLS